LYPKWVRTTSGGPLKKYTLIVSTLGIILSFQNCGGYKATRDSSNSSLSSLDGKYNDPANNPTIMCSTTDPGKTLLRRLNKDEFANSLRDILGLGGVATNSIPTDITSTEGFSNNASFLTLNSIYLYELMKIIETSVTASMISRPETFKCDPVAGQVVSNPVCAKILVQSFGRKAYRRSLASAEVDQLVGFVSKQLVSGAVFRDAVGLAYQRILMSPLFLFRTSFGKAGAPTGIALLTPHEFVTRLAYFLWNSPPDEKLLALADQDKLSTVDAVKAEVTRMLKDPKALRFNESFVGQWIGTRGLTSDIATRTGLTLQMQRDMKTETETFTAAIIQGSGSPMDFISADYSYINEGLANHYGISGVAGPQFQKVNIAGTPRRGLLTQGAFLTLNSADDRSKPTARGNAILENITCTPPPPFPDGLTVTPLDGNDSGTLTLKQRLANHTKSVACAGCHVDMDQLGLGLENFDQIGRFRQTYLNGLVIDPSGALRGKSFRDSADLLNILRQEKDFKKCITKKLMTYALGRTIASTDQCALSVIGDSAVQPEKSFLDLVVSIVLSEQFRMNRTDSRGE